MANSHALGNERVAIRLGHEDQAIVEGDPDRLKQLLLNLIDNALKYTPGGGNITLSLYHDRAWVRVSVADTGVGIPADALPHIFDRFYRAQRNGRKGAGLGLSIARWIAEAHGGGLTVESQVSKGSTFTLWLPTDAREEHDNVLLDDKAIEI
jgi:two-component system, OmpR family, sensor kinase